jgi:hypothetical protein
VGTDWPVTKGTCQVPKCLMDKLTIEEEIDLLLDQILASQSESDGEVEMEIEPEAPITRKGRPPKKVHSSLFHFYLFILLQGKTNKHKSCSWWQEKTKGCSAGGTKP